MTTARSAPERRAALFSLLVAVAAVGCTEQASTRAPATPEPTMEASLVLSRAAPAVGSTVDVFAQMATATPGLVGSYTARIRYDSTALRYQEDVPLAGQVLRATNATSGLVRFAGAAAAGVPDGRLAGFRFAVLRPGAERTLQLVVDEIHTVARADAASMLRAAPNGVEARP